MKYSWELSTFDTEILGFRTAKITHIELNNDRKTIDQYVSDLKSDLKQQEIGYATYRISAGDYSLIQSLERNGFILVDGLITLETMLIAKDDSDFSYVKEATMDDLKQLVNISNKVFRGVSRYYHDPMISQERADHVYEEWIKNSIKNKAADLVLAWKENGNILGFITLQKKGQIPLIGVSEKARGRGIGKGLLFVALQTFRDWGLEKVVIETQITNLAALRLYQSCGFKICASYLTFRLSLL